MYGVALALAFVTSAHAVRPEALTPSDAFAGRVEALGLPVEAVIDPFEVTPEMTAFAREATRFAPSPLDKLEALQRALVDPSFGFAYDKDATLTAAEVFALRRGNCLAFTALFVGLARSVGIDAFLASIRDA